jgi:GT2 family glycosyltransferase
MEHKITTCISSNNNLEYLKLAVQSVRQNAYYKDMPIIVYAENCTDGTDEWLTNNPYNVEYYIEKNKIEKGIGGGMDFCVNKTKTEFVNIIHSDMWVAPNQDIELLKLYDNIDKDTRLIASSFRIQPKIFPNDPDYRPGTVFFPIDALGAYYHDFDSNSFDSWANDFSNQNELVVRKGGGAGFFCRKKDYEWIGGNDPLFAPASWEDKDLFIRMQLEDYQFKMTTKSLVWHFSARGSHFRDEAKDNFNSRSQRQIKSEQVNIQKFINKWGRLPEDDDQTFVKPIKNTNVKTRLGSYEDKFNSALSK